MHTIPTMQYHPHSQPLQPATVAQRGRQRRLRVVSGGLLCLASVACGSDTTGLAPQDLTTAYWILRLNHHAITMALPAPYNVVPLTATPLTQARTQVPGAGSIQYSTPDSTVTVDSLGHLTAKYATLGQSARVIASLTIKGVTLADTALVQVDSFPLAHPLTTFSIHPQGTTCRESATNNYFTLPTYAIDAAGDTLHNAHVAKFPVYYTSSDPTIATIDRSYGNVYGWGPGTITFTANALIDGIVRQDTLTYILDPHRTVYIATTVQHSTGSGSPTLTFTPSQITVDAGWTVFFVDSTLDTVDVVFSDPTHGTSGTIAGQYDNTGTKIFPGMLYEVFFDAGTYAYHSTRYGQSGTIRVQCGYTGS